VVPTSKKFEKRGFKRFDSLVEETGPGKINEEGDVR
jgi:hypothetical protein